MTSKFSPFEVHGFKVPSWVPALGSFIYRQILPVHGPLGGFVLACNPPANDEAPWDIAVSPRPNEAYRGPHDGSTLIMGIQLKLLPLLDAFSQVDSIVWDAPAGYNEHREGPKIEIRGTFLENPVLLRVFSFPPSGVEPALLLDISTGECIPRTPDVTD